jgi:hypothetical protein
VGISETPEAAAGVHDLDNVHNNSNGQRYQIALPCQVPHEKRPPTRHCLTSRPHEKLGCLRAPDQPRFPLLDPETYHDARTIAPGYDVYFLEMEWQAFWYDSGQPELKDPDAAFLGFCRSRHNRKPSP